MWDVADIENEDGVITVIAPQTEFFKTKTALAKAFTDISLEVEEITFVPQTYTELGAEDTEQLDKFLDLLNDCDDVQEVYHNADL